MIDLAKQNSLTSRIPNGLIKHLVVSAKAVAPWLTYDKVVGYYQTQVEKRSIDVGVDAPVVRADKDEAATNVGAIIQIMNPLEPPIKIDVILVVDQK